MDRKLVVGMVLAAGLMFLPWSMLNGAVILDQPATPTSDTSITVTGSTDANATVDIFVNNAIDDVAGYVDDNSGIADSSGDFIVDDVGTLELGTNSLAGVAPEDLNDVYSWDFNMDGEVQGWWYGMWAWPPAFSYGDPLQQVHDGSFHAVCGNPIGTTLGLWGYVYIIPAGSGIDGDALGTGDVKVRIRMKSTESDTDGIPGNYSTASGGFGVYMVTNPVNYIGWPLTPTVDGQFHIYEFVVPFNFTGWKINELRVQLPWDTTNEIDFVQIVSLDPGSVFNSNFNADGDAEGWSPVWYVYQFTVADGACKVAGGPGHPGYTPGAPVLAWIEKAVHVPGASAAFAEIRMKVTDVNSDNDGIANTLSHVGWMGNWGNYYAQRNFDVISDGDFHTYQVDLKDWTPDWENWVKSTDIAFIRVGIPWDSTVEIDYVHLEPYAWGFDHNFEGWNGVGTGLGSVAGGILTGVFPAIGGNISETGWYSPAGLSIDGSIFDRIELSMKVVPSGDGVSYYNIFWDTDDTPGMDEQHGKRNNTAYRDGEWHVYTADMTSGTYAANWIGQTVRQFKIHVPDNANVYIDYIKVSSAGYGQKVYVDIETMLVVKPESMNNRGVSANGKTNEARMTAFVYFSDKVNVSTATFADLTMNGAVPVKVIVEGDENKLILKFLREEVNHNVSPYTVTGTVNGIPFSCSDETKK